MRYYGRCGLQKRDAAGVRTHIFNHIADPNSAFDSHSMLLDASSDKIRRAWGIFFEIIFERKVRL